MDGMMINFPFTTLRKFNAEHQARLDAERRANQMEYVLRASQSKSVQKTDMWGFPASLAPSAQTVKLTPDQTEQIFSVTGHVIRELFMTDKFAASGKTVLPELWTREFKNGVEREPITNN